jgi:two-component system, NarL family, sensor histidine kinase UhpB
VTAWGEDSSVGWAETGTAATDAVLIEAQYYVGAPAPLGRGPAVGDDACMNVPSPRPHMRDLPLFWRIFVLNGLVFLAGVSSLAFSPATVSSPPLPTEVLVLGVGLVIMLVMNALLLRVGLAPMGRLIGLMEHVDLLRPGHRLPEQGNRDLEPLVESFNQMLARLETERSASTARVLSAQEDERRRIALELHDEIGQSLTVVLLALKQLSEQAPVSLRPGLLEVQQHARTSLDDVKRIAQRLRPDMLEELGLTAALKALAHDFEELIQIPVSTSLAPGLPETSEEVEVVIYRIAQEGLTNIARHAHAEQVRLSLAATAEGGLRLTIRDDGTGTRSPEGGGIRGMRERALLVHADLQIDSRPGEGTEVCLDIPTQHVGLLPGSSESTT